MARAEDREVNAMLLVVGVIVVLALIPVATVISNPALRAPILYAFGSAFVLIIVLAICMIIGGFRSGRAISHMEWPRNR